VSYYKRRMKTLMYMKKILLVLFLYPFIAFTQTTKAYTITGNLIGVADGTEIKLVRNGESTEFAKTKIQKGVFSFKGNVKEPELCYIIVGDKSSELYLENSKITISNTKEQPGKYSIKGSSSHKDFLDFTTKFVPLFQQMNSLATAINSMAAGTDRDKQMELYNNTQKNVQTEIDNYVNSKQNSMVTPFVLNVTSQFYDDPILLETRFNKLTKTVRESDMGMQLGQLIAEKKIGAVGTQALDFTQPDTTGKPLSLSSFRGKYVLVDFWASWCGPCRYENPNVVESYNQFNSKNFTILSVSLDKPGQKDKWLEAIKKDNLTWSHVSDLQFWNNAAAQLYHIQQIPQNLLIDPSGKIVGKNLRGPALKAKLCELLGGCN